MENKIIMTPKIPAKILILSSTGSFREYKKCLFKIISGNVKIYDCSEGQYIADFGDEGGVIEVSKTRIKVDSDGSWMTIGNETVLRKSLDSRTLVWKNKWLDLTKSGSNIKSCPSSMKTTDILLDKIPIY